MRFNRYAALSAFNGFRSGRDSQPPELTMKRSKGTSDLTRSSQAKLAELDPDQYDSNESVFGCEPFFTRRNK